MLVLTPARVRLGPPPDGGAPASPAAAERRLRKLFEEWAKDISQAMAPELEEAIRTGKLNLDSPAWAEAWSAIDEAWTAQVHDLIERQGQAEIARLKVRLRFDINNPHAAAAAKAMAAERVTQVTVETKASLRAAVVKGLEEQLPVAQTARLIRPTIGLTERDATAVLNRAAKLRADGATEKQVQKATEQYSARLLRRRADNIARTETIGAQNAGQLASWNAATDAGFLPDGSEKEWIAGTGSDRTCPICLDFNGRTAALNEPFVSAAYGSRMTAPAHPSCRCTMGIKRRAA